MKTFPSLGMLSNAEELAIFLQQIVETMQKSEVNTSRILSFQDLPI